MGFRTGVRLPSGPLDREVANPFGVAKIAVFENVFSLIVTIDECQAESTSSAISFVMIQKWVQERYGVNVSKSSISQVKSKCGMSVFDTTQKVKAPELNTEKEKLVLEAFRHFELVD